MKASTNAQRQNQAIVIAGLAKNLSLKLSEAADDHFGLDPELITDEDEDKIETLRFYMEKIDLLLV